MIYCRTISNHWAITKLDLNKNKQVVGNKWKDPKGLPIYALYWWICNKFVRKPVNLCRSTL